MSAPERAPRVLVVTNIWPAGEDDFRGVFVRDQLDELRALGVEADVEVIAQDRGAPDYLAGAARVRARARAGRYDLVHAYFGLSAFAARFVGGLPRVVTLLGSDVNAGWKRAAGARWWRSADARIYVSRRLAERAREPEAPVIPFGVDFDLFAPVARAGARAALGLAPDARLVLFAAEPEKPVKRYEVFGAVLAELRARGVAAEELVLPERGQARARVPLKFAAADAMLFTSREGSEGAPQVVREACAMGLPVVSVDVGDVSEVLDGVKPSAVVPFPGDEGRLVTALADATAAVLALDGARSNGRESGAAVALREGAERVLGVYRDVLAGRAAVRDRQP